MKKVIFSIVGILLVSSCVLTFPVSETPSSDTTVREENEIKKEEALNVTKVQKEEKAKAKQQEKNTEEQKSTEGKGGGGN